MEARAQSAEFLAASPRSSHISSERWKYWNEFGKSWPVLEMASWAELFGRLIPRASIAEAMVLAVYMPPQEPGPGIAVSAMFFSSMSETVPLA